MENKALLFLSSFPKLQKKVYLFNLVYKLDKNKEKKLRLFGKYFVGFLLLMCLCINDDVSFLN